MAKMKIYQIAGIEKAIQCHSSFIIASCVVCKAQVDAKRVREDLFSQTILSLQVHVSLVS